MENRTLTQNRGRFRGAGHEHFKKLLETEKDPHKRAVIKRELAEEEAKLVAFLKEQGRGKNDC